jgi:uncharacterized caspase-like protein
MFQMARVLLALAVALIAGAAQASEKRVALIIGNAAYRSAPPLANALNDAELISATLKTLGFEVLDGRNLTKDGMGKLLGNFARELRGADAGLVYYAGHGLQFEGQNYLLPIDASIEDEFSLSFETIRLDDVMTTLRYASGVQILVLDACRNNPFVAKLGRKSGSRDIALRSGLAPVKRTQGMIVAYATQSNDVATDGEGSNSPFTAALAREMKRPGQEIATVFRKVQTQVYTSTGGRQLPELSISLLGEFFINAGESDLEAWKKASLSDDAEQLKAFMTAYPESSWIEAARSRLQELADKQRFMRESAEREQIIRELSLKAEQLGEQIRQAEEKRLRAMQELEVKTQSASQNASREETDDKAKSEANAKKERERLAAEARDQQSIVLTLSEERRRIDAERKTAELAVEQRLKAQSMPEEPAKAREKKAALDKKREEPKADPPRAPAVTPPAEKNRAPRCADVMARLQLGETTQADLEAIKQCNR